MFYLPIIHNFINDLIKLKPTSLLLNHHQDKALVRLVKASSSSTVAVMPYIPNEFDLGGMELVTYNLPWKPYIDIGCDESGDCQEANSIESFCLCSELKFKCFH